MKTLKGFARERLLEVKKRKKQVYLKVYMSDWLMEMLEELAKETETTKSGFMRLLLASFIKLNLDRVESDKLAVNVSYGDIDLSSSYGQQTQKTEN